MKVRLNKVRRMIRVPLPMLMLLFICNFSWATANHPSDDRLNNAGFIDPGDHGTVLSNVPSICQIIQNIISNPIQSTDFSEPLDELQDKQCVYLPPFQHPNIAAISIAINAP